MIHLALMMVDVMESRILTVLLKEKVTKKEIERDEMTNWVALLVEPMEFLLEKYWVYLLENLTV